MKRTLAKELNLAIALTLITVGILFALFFFPQQKQQKKEFIRERIFFLETFKRSEERVLSDPIFERQVEALNMHIERLAQTEGIVAITVFGPNGEILAETPPDVTDQLLTDQQLDYMSKTFEAIQTIHNEDGAEHIVYTSPIVIVGETLGYLQMHYSLKDFERQQKSDKWFLLFLFLAVLLTTTILLNFRLSSLVTKPLHRLIKIVKHVEDGNLDIRASKVHDDEIGKLNDSFNGMISRLQTSFVEVEKQNIELKELDRLRKEFIANVTHELRTPLHAIIGFSEGMLEEVKDEEHKRYLQLILDNGRSLDKIAAQLLTLSGLKSHGIKLHCEPFHIKEISDKVSMMVPKIIGNKDIHFKDEISKNLPMVLADQSRVQQIFLNLVENSIKFTNEGFIVLSAKPQNSSLVEITVSDTGMGISEEMAKYIFEEFRQGDGSTERKHGGVGLGLAIVKELVTLHGGQIWVESLEGKGASFHFTLPQA